jgi:tRNA pseudouridine55 synthase
MPPLFSAIKINGMKAYEYARSGKELPRELETRDVEVSECSMLEFYAPGAHDFRWPAEQADEEEKAIAKRLMAGGEETKQAVAPDAGEGIPSNSTNEKPEKTDINKIPYEKKAAMHIHTAAQEDVAADAPAARIRLNVSSGFYVRSFAYDLGIACGSYGAMASLVRSQQASYTTVEPAPEGFIPTLTYEDLEAGEDVWGPKISAVLEKWLEEHPETSTQKDSDDRDRDYSRRHNGNRGSRGRGGGRGRSWNQGKDNGSRGSKRRNSSSSGSGA